MSSSTDTAESPTPSTSGVGQFSESGITSQKPTHAHSRSPTKSSTDTAESPASTPSTSGAGQFSESRIILQEPTRGHFRSPTKNVRKQLFPSKSELQPEASTSRLQPQASASMLPPQSFTSSYSPPKKRQKKCPLSRAEKNMIMNVYKTELDADPSNLISDIVKKTSASTGVSTTTVYRVVAEYKRGEFSSPKKSKKRMTILDAVDDFDQTAIRRKVHEFFFKNEIPTIDKMLKAVNDDPDLPSFKRTTFYQLIKVLNFKYAKRDRNSALVDRDEIVVWRRNYLKSIKKFREENRRIYYLDETWLNAGHTRSRVWKDETVKSSRQAFLSGLSTGLKNPTGKGNRLIITHIGSDSGFVDGGLWIFQSKTTGDYHEEMNSKNFEKWFSNCLEKLEENAVIVLDNAPYHSRRVENLPTTSWRKDSVKQWLVSKNIAFDEGMLKAELMQIVRQHKSMYQAYAVDEMAKARNKLVLRLPPYHCELNPIEMIWADIKNYVAARNVTFKLADAKNLLEQAISTITAEKWKNCVQHVSEKVETRFWELDNIIESITEPLIIDVSGNESDSSSNSSNT